MTDFKNESHVRQFLKLAVELVSDGQLNDTRLNEQPAAFDYSQLQGPLGDQLAGEFMQLQNDLRLELTPHHAADSEILFALWELLRHVVSNSEEFLLEDSLNQLIVEFGGKWKPPLKVFKVVYPVENLNIGANPITIGSVTFRLPEEDFAATWGISSPWAQAEVEKSETRSLASIRVESADHSKASETGIQPVLDAIEVLRVSALSGLVNRLEVDELLQWRLSGYWAAMDLEGDATEALSGWRRPFKPLVIDIGSAVKIGLEADSYSDALSATLPMDIKARLLRSTRWISTSVVHEDHDHKIVDLCTALETMLLADYLGGRKGELVALRYNLVGGYMNPAGILRLYELRSGIVHGAELGTAWAMDTWHLRGECVSVLANLLKLVKDKPEVVTLTGLIAVVETPDRLEEFINRCGLGVWGDEGIGSIKKCAERRLKQVAARR